MGDRLRERLEGVAGGFRRQAAGPHGTDQAAEHRIGAGEMREDMPAHGCPPFTGRYF